MNPPTLDELRAMLGMQQVDGRDGQKTWAVPGVGQVPTSDMVQTRHQRLHRWWPDHHHPLEISTLPGPLRNKPEFTAIEGERNAIAAARHAAQRAHSEITNRNRQREADHRLAVEAALEASKIPPAPPELEVWHGDVVPWDFWTDKLRSVAALEHALVATMRDDIAASLKLPGARSKKAEAIKALQEAEAELELLTNAYGALERVKLPEGAPSPAPAHVAAEQAVEGRRMPPEPREVQEAQRMLDESRRAPRRALRPR